MLQDGFFSNLDRLVNPPEIKAITNFQNTVSNVDISAFKRVADVVNSPFYKSYQTKPLFSNTFEYGKVMESINAFSDFNNRIASVTNIGFRYTEIQKFLNCAKFAMPAIDNLNASLTAFTKIGVFETISNISKIISAFDFIERLNVLTPVDEPVDSDFYVSDDNDIFIDNEPITREDLDDLYQQFISLKNETDYLKKENSILNERINLINKNKKFKSLINILRFIICSVLFSPVFQDINSVIRQETGIDKLIEQIHITEWVNDFRIQIKEVIADLKLNGIDLNIEKENND
jgi:hypothetical protein